MYLKHSQSSMLITCFSIPHGIACSTWFYYCYD